MGLGGNLLLYGPLWRGAAWWVVAEVTSPPTSPRPDDRRRHRRPHHTTLMQVTGSVLDYHVATFERCATYGAILQAVALVGGWVEVRVFPFAWSGCHCVWLVSLSAGFLHNIQRWLRFALQSRHHGFEESARAILVIRSISSGVPPLTLAVKIRIA